MSKAPSCVMGITFKVAFVFSQSICQGTMLLWCSNADTKTVSDFVSKPANPFATPLEILPEWYFFPTFNLLRVLPNKLLGVLSMAAVPAGLLTVPFIENVNKFQNPFRRPVAMTVFFVGTVFAVWFGFGAAMPIDKAVTLGLF